ncbi:protein NEGATIVE GRAVITROPIC RESPONSE OF ROOTS-like [Magnolia sinica]|uniref:protein NEGATIVE GRAVITROPIC RESPONSE OF ROOTS-like n=1 Tax=Magnolia sinica TaxID=86752 RepID=UPI002658413C|nr:protein NEGATIVE GRAVITROPIC RESPONSE OF ROOTS-like [Magnolia sinica]
MQNKINGRHESKRWTVGSSSSSSSSSNRFPIQEHCKEEFSDWPDGLLAIGTFGNNQLKEEIERHDLSENPIPSSQDEDEPSDFTKEEVGKLQNELLKLLSRKPVANEEGEKVNLPLDKFLNCPSSLEVDRTNCQQFCNHDSNGMDSQDLSRNSNVVLSKGKEVFMDNNNVIRQRSLSFLIKKMFVCRGGFSPAPSLRDSVPESRMEKILKTILHKKIYPQNSASTSARKCLPYKHTLKEHSEDQTLEKARDGCKWVKTDSEFIVLEI